MKKFLIFFVLCLSFLLAMAQQHELPRHRAYQWSGLTLDDLQGSICVPVIFINFTDATNDNEKAVSVGNQDLWMNRLNDNCTANHMGEDGSVNDYFLAQSYGAMNVTFENVGSYTAEGKASDYTAYSSCAKLMRKAVTSLSDVSWSRYDSNGDMQIDCVLAIYAGHCDDDESSRRAVITSIYPHQNWLSSVDHTRQEVGEGYFVESYVFANDLRDRSTSLAAINTVCHELGHGIFDLSDYYRNLTSYMGQYDAMCYGYRQMSYGASNDHCCDYTSFNRMFLGWMTPRELCEPCHVRLEPLSTSGDACVIFDPSNASHFFLLENRATIEHSWDAHLPAGGLIVVEVNWQQSAFEYHNVNSSNKKNIRVICAGTQQGLALSNDTYYNFDQTQIPYGINGHSEITSRVNNIFSTQTVTGIIVNDDLSVEFDYMGGGAGLEVLSEEPASGRLYDLFGRRAVTSADGFTIRDGKPVIIRNY